MKKLILTILLLGSFNLFAFTTTTLSTPAKRKLYIGIGGFYLDNSRDDITLGVDPRVAFGLGGGFSLEAGYMIPLKEGVTDRSALSILIRKDIGITRKGDLGVTLAGGVGMGDLSGTVDWFFPFRAGLKVSFPVATIAGGISSYVDFFERNGGGVWGGLELPFGSSLVRLEYTYFVFDDIGFRQMINASFTVRL